MGTKRGGYVEMGRGRKGECTYGKVRERDRRARRERRAYNTLSSNVLFMSKFNNTVHTL